MTPQGNNGCIRNTFRTHEEAKVVSTRLIFSSLDENSFNSALYELNTGKRITNDWKVNQLGISLTSFELSTKSSFALRISGPLTATPHETLACLPFCMDVAFFFFFFWQFTTSQSSLSQRTLMTLRKGPSYTHQFAKYILLVVRNLLKSL